MKKIIAAILALCLIGGNIPGVCFNKADNITAICAETPVWNGTEDTSWFEGEYVESEDGKYKMYSISTAEELAGLSKLVRDGNEMEDIVINLTSDIILNDTSNFANWETEPPANNWIPIGIYPKGAGEKALFSAKFTEFHGVFNGNGHVIRGLYCDHDNMAGLFAYVTKGGVTSVILEDAYVHAENYRQTYWDTIAGGIAAESTGGIISQCEFNGKVSAKGLDNTRNGQHDCSAAGIVGKSPAKANDAVIFATLLAAFGVFVNPILYSGSGGGLVQNAGIYECINRGEIKAEQNKHGAIQSAGIIGCGNNGLVMNCIDLGTNTSEEGYIGGIIGRSFKLYMNNCYYANTEKGLGSTDAAGDAEDTAVNISLSKYSKEEVAQKLGDSFEYRNNDTYLKCDTRQFEKPVVVEPVVPQQGDVNEDGIINAVDASRVLVFYAELNAGETEVSEKDMALCDINKDNMINAVDASLILAYYASLNADPTLTLETFLADKLNK